MSLFDRDGSDLAEVLLAQDAVFVGGGSTLNLLLLWRAHGLDTALRAALEDGVVLSGVSAGMNCWFESSVTDSHGPLRPLEDGLGFLPGSACPHYDGEAERRPTYLDLVGSRTLPAGYAVEDGVAAAVPRRPAGRGGQRAAGRAGVPRAPERRCARRRRRGGSRRRRREPGGRALPGLSDPGRRTTRGDVSTGRTTLRRAGAQAALAAWIRRACCSRRAWAARRTLGPPVAMP